MWNSICGAYKKEMKQTIEKIATKGKGILAADESTGTIGKRFQNINVENNQKNRKDYRKLLFSSYNIENFISGVITFEETLKEENDDGTPLIKLLQDKGIVVGIKTDKGVVSLTTGLKSKKKCEGFTQGLDGLGDRCKEYYKLGARFAKWRATYHIDKEKSWPSNLQIEENSKTLAKYAIISQSSGLVPIVEPEVLVLEGNKNELIESYDICKKIFSNVFMELINHGVDLECIILKPNFILPTKSKLFAAEKKIPDFTIDCLKATVPSSVSCIMFLSGGLSEEKAVDILNRVNKVKCEKPWYLSFSYGRALQTSCLKEWNGKKDNIKSAQLKFIQQCELCSKATKGEAPSCKKESGSPKKKNK